MKAEQVAALSCCGNPQKKEEEEEEKVKTLETQAAALFT